MGSSPAPFILGAPRRSGLKALTFIQPGGDSECEECCRPLGRPVGFLPMSKVPGAFDLGLSKSSGSVRIGVISGNDAKNHPTERTGHPDSPFEKS